MKEKMQEQHSKQRKQAVQQSWGGGTRPIWNQQWGQCGYHEESKGDKSKSWG